MTQQCLETNPEEKECMQDDGKHGQLNVNMYIGHSLAVPKLARSLFLVVTSGVTLFLGKPQRNNIQPVL